ncbi:hypothetical protein [Halobellus sp. GM3]
MTRRRHTCETAAASAAARTAPRRRSSNGALGAVSRIIVGAL